MGDFDNLLTRIGIQIEEMKKRIRSSRDLAGHHTAETPSQQAPERPLNKPRVESFHTRAENRPDEPVTRR